MNKGNKAIRHEGNKRYRGIAFKLLKIFAIPKYIYTSIRPFFRFSIPPYLNTSIPRRKRSLLFGFNLIELMISLIVVSTIAAAFAPAVSKKMSMKNVHVKTDGGLNINCTPPCYLCDKKGEKCYLCRATCNGSNYLDIAACECKPCSNAALNCSECYYDKESETGVCTKCNPGYYLNNNQCIQCDKGYYCPDGINKVACNPNNGEYQDTIAQSSPKSCKTNGNNCYKCKSASEGTCATCPKGYGYSSNTCTICSAGKYQADNNSTSSCSNCDAGYWCSAGSDTPTQHACDAGAYSNAGAANCTPCPAGTYCSTSACTGCTTCSAGWYNSGTGNTGCSACLAGHKCTGGANIEQCPAGTYAPTDSTTGGWGHCEACPSTAYSAAGAASCSPCTNWHAQCKTCSTSGCSTCNSGYHVNSAGTGCDPDFDCSGSSYVKIGSLCITKYNIGDNLSIPSAAGVTVKKVGQTCTQQKCCFQGNTSRICSNGGTYNGCYRKVCNWYAANAICSNLNLGGKTWRLPTSSEIYSWISYAKSTLLLCDSQSDGGGWIRCDGSEDDFCITSGFSYTDCIPYELWTSSSGTAIALLNESFSTWGSDARAPKSVRCVTNM